MKIFDPRRLLSRDELAAQIERAPVLLRQLGWVDESLTGCDVMDRLRVRGLLPPHVVTTRRKAGSGRGIEFLPSAGEWVQELGRRVQAHGWKSARGPMLAYRHALMANKQPIGRENRLVYSLLLDRCVADLMNIEVGSDAALQRAAEWVLVWRGRPSSAEHAFKVAVDEGARHARERLGPRKSGGILGSDALASGPLAVLRFPPVADVSAFLGRSAVEFARRRKEWRETLCMIMDRPDSAKNVLAERHGISGPELEPVCWGERGYPALPSSWEAYLTWRLSVLSFQRSATLGQHPKFRGNPGQIFGTTPSGSISLRLADGRVAGGTITEFE